MSQISSHIIVHRYNSLEVVFQHQPDRVGIFSTFFYLVYHIRVHTTLAGTHFKALFFSSHKSRHFLVANDSQCANRRFNHSFYNLLATMIEIYYLYQVIS